MKKKKEENKNPYHKEYGLFSNMKYVLGNMFRLVPKFMLYIPIGIVCAPLMNYLWTFISKFVIDMITGEGGWENLLYLMGIITAIQIVSTMASTWRGSKWGYYVFVRLKMLVQKNRKIMTMNYQNIEDPDMMDCFQKAGNAANSNNSGIEGMMHQTVSLLECLAVAAVGLIIMGTLNPWIMLILIVLSAVSFAIKNYANAKAKKEVWDPLANWWRRDDYMRYTACDFTAAKDIRMFGLRKWLTEKYREIKKERYQAQVKNAKIWFTLGTVSNVCFAVCQLLVYGWLLYLATMGEITLGNFSFYVASAATFYSHIWQIMDSVADLLQRSREVDDWRSFLDLDSGDPDEGKPVPEYDHYEFEFKNVSFRYPKAESYALKKLSLTLRAGERLAVVGLNGAGKSTFIKLLLRLYEPTEGEILLNGVNVREYSKKSYYRIFSPVFQDVNLFAFPLSENVSMQVPDQTDKALAEKCLNDAGMAEKLKELSAGVNTEITKIISDDGTNLSGGECQKLALARALYKDAPVVVLDEPTAALDALAESKLYGDFDQLIGGKTAVYISHRLSSTQFCNEVAMFKDGELVELGTHRALLEQGGAYAEMFKIQAQYYIENPEEVAAHA